MRYFLEIARTGLTAILLHPLRSVVTTACVVVLLLPFLVGLALSKGVEHEARASIRFGADLYVSGDQIGRRVPSRWRPSTKSARSTGFKKLFPGLWAASFLAWKMKARS